MACASCGTKSADGSPAGCKSNGNCDTGGCNRMSTFDWLTIEGVRDVEDQHYVEVAFKNGARKEFFYCPPETGASTGDTVVVETERGSDTGCITLSGELVLMQMQRRRVKMGRVRFDVIRVAHERDLERLREARSLEMETLVRARVLAYSTELPLKLTDVEYQGDLRKATFYYTSEQRIDFRELIKMLAREFRIKVEMRQIGARQETARLGGVGSCGRELCCSTWLTDFKSVNISAARYQGLSVNQAKLSGQCGRLKCCLNYELDTYLDALKDFPKKADKIRYDEGKAILVKTDVFKGLMHYQVLRGRERGPYVTMTVEQVHKVLAMPKRTIHTFTSIEQERQRIIDLQTEDEPDYEDVIGAIDIPVEKRKKKKRRKKKAGEKPQNRGSKQAQNRSRNNQRKRPAKPTDGKSGEEKTGSAPKRNQQRRKKTTNASEQPKDGKPANSRNKRREPRGPRSNGPRKPNEGSSGKKDA